jgi:amidase
MADTQSRREFLIAAGGAAMSSALPIAVAFPPRAFAQAAANTSKSSGSEFRTARDLAAALVGRHISAAELVAHAIARIEALDGRINGVVVRDFDRARAAAVEADAALARGERRPLLGVPMTVKEAYNVAGLPTTWGIPRFKDWRPTADAVAVARVKAAGAIILGKTNVPFALADWQTFNDIYGTTNNPWDLGRTPGGSSGGAAASLAAGYVPLELGSDIGGSLRAPAHYCGVFSHKPSFGLVPSRGHTPPRAEALPREVDLAVIGPMARSAGDLALALDIIAGPDEPDAIAYRLALPPARQTDLKAFRVLVIDTHPLLPTANTVRAALDRLAGRLVKAGSRVERASPFLPDFTLTARIYTQLLTSFFGADYPIDVYRRVQEAVASLPPEDSSLTALRARGIVLSHRDWIAADRVRGMLSRQWRDLFREWDVVLTPVMPTPAFPHDHTADMRARRIQIDGVDYPYQDQLVWPGVATAPGLPATVAPIDRSDTGLPIGVQIIGPYLEDRTTIAFADLIEREFGGFVPPPAFKA